MAARANRPYSALNEETKTGHLRICRSNDELTLAADSKSVNGVFALFCSDTYKCTISCEGGVTGLSVDKEALESYGDLRRILYVDSQTLRVNLLNHGSHEFEAPGSCV